ncbi:hypothetical protein ACSBR2_030010 [Camellia fascicularis]
MSKWLTVLCIALVWCCYFCSIPAATSVANNETDGVALLAFRAAIVEDPFGALSSWNHSFHFCLWNGILCSRRHPDRVIGLNLTSQGLVGLLSPHIGNLSFLKSIILHNNSFHGTIPQEMGRLFRLQTTEFSYNLFGGGIPNNLSRCSRLERLNFTNNNLTGNIPAEFGYLSKLRTLALNTNKLSGTIPHFIGNLSSLSILSLGECNLHGKIPAEIARLQGLICVWLRNISYFTVKTLQNLKIHSSVQMISAGQCREILENFGDDLTFIWSLTNCTSLQIIEAVDNLFRGSWPNSIANLSTYLSWMHLRINQIHGSVPSGIMNLLNLTSLSMAVNNLVGPIPSSISRLHKLQVLQLDQNKFTELPSSIGNLTSLITLHLGENNIHGSIPPSLGNCHSLLELGLHKNDLKGSIPLEIMSLSSISKFLSLDHNALIGSLPSEVRRDTSKFEYAEGLTSIGSFVQQFVKTDPKLSRLHGQVPLQGVFQNGSTISIVGNNELCGELLKATNGFSEANLIGVGSYASVYKGIMITVDFHGNEFKALKHNISIDIASALEYLHCGCESTIIHGDLKPSNVLLDDEMTTHIGDFGLAKIISTVSSNVAQSQSNSVAIRGTIGYVAPEYDKGDMASILGDVYSFGILLLEMFTGKRPTDAMFKDHLNLHNFVKNALPDPVMEIVYPYIPLEHNTRS